MIGACVPGSSRGRPGLTCETILRCAVLMHLMGYSYRGLEFALLDSASVQRFARVDPFRVPKKSALQSAVGAIDADTWQAINGVLLQDAKQRGIESGTQVRIDSTVTETDILEPSDSRLLYDGVRVLMRGMRVVRYEQNGTVGYGRQRDDGSIVAIDDGPAAAAGRAWEIALDAPIGRTEAPC